jgi:outer membrane receptor protein involved in Fe transport
VAVTRAARTPSRQDQDVAFDIFAGYLGVGTPPSPTPVYFEIQGNPKSKAEHLIGYEAGYRTQVSNNLYLDFTAFYNNYTGLQGFGPASFVEASPGAPVFAVLPYANIIEGDTVGAEIAPEWKVTHWWQLRGSYSYLEMDLRDKTRIYRCRKFSRSLRGLEPPQSRGRPIALQSAKTLRARRDVQILERPSCPKRARLQHR